MIFYQGLKLTAELFGN